MFTKEKVLESSRSRNSSTTSVRNENRTTSYTFSERHSTVSTSGEVSRNWNVREFSSTSALPRTIFDLPSGLDRDAKVWNQDVRTRGYQSPFNRQLTAYRSAGSVPSTSTPSVSNYRSTSVSLPSPATPVMSYDVNGKKQILIINNVKFLQKNEERKGAEKDEQKLTEIFKNLGFSVTKHRDLKRSEMRSKIQKFSSKSDLSATKLIVIVIMSHGHNMDNNRVIRGGYTQILGTDGKGLEVDEILEMFTSQNCPKMRDKPKIFIFQNCRGEQQEVIHVDAAPIAPRTKVHADMLLAFSTLPGFYSLRDPLQGSWYIQSLCDVLAKQGKYLDIERVLKMVDQQLSTKHPQYSQTSTYESRGFNKTCYLYRS